MSTEGNYEPPLFEFHTLLDEQIHILLSEINEDACSYLQAIESENSQKWLEAISEEINSLIENDV